MTMSYQRHWYKQALWGDRIISAGIAAAGPSQWSCRSTVTSCSSNCLHQVVHPSNAMVCGRMRAQLNVWILVRLVLVAVAFCQLTCPPTKVAWGQSGFQPEGALRDKIFATPHPKKICWRLTFPSAANPHHHENSDWSACLSRISTYFRH